MRRWPLSSKRFLPWLILALLLSLPLLLDTLFPLPRYRLFPPSSLQIYADNGELARVFLTPDQKVRLRVRLDEVPPTLLRTFLLSEDRFFLFHQGFNPLAIVRAL
ncbi:MAG TPA: transglycosylase domain-containing protein, partial [Candidatus Aminicenantes bacterium]|nr:transglycosylase domain-containing protein [Candidatus Aminicenantes bacterium]